MSSEPTSNPWADETGFDAALFERLDPMAGAALRAILLTLGVAGTTGIASLLFHSHGLTHRAAVMAALPVGVGVGFLFALGLILWPSRRSAAHRKRLIERIEAVARVDREEAFSLLLKIDKRHELAELAHTIHDALAAAHKDRLEAARIKRDFTHKVQRESERNTAHLARLTTTDDLSGLINRRGFEQALSQMIERARRESREVALVALDMDHFKLLNDTHGHEAGDQAIVIVGELIRANLEHGHIGARMGGDEFILALFDSDHARAKVLVERLMRLFQSHPAGVGRSWPTLSAGVALLNADRAGNATELRRLADTALYAAKRDGRNRVALAPRG
jgi:diguanylate cyclase (GGDEF)-like protein